MSQIHKLPYPSNHYHSKNSSPNSTSYSSYLSPRNTSLTKPLIRLQGSENQITHLLASLCNNFTKDEGQRDRLGRTEGENVGIKGNVRNEARESEKIYRNKRKCNNTNRRRREKR